MDVSIVINADDLCHILQHLENELDRYEERISEWKARKPRPSTYVQQLKIYKEERDELLATYEDLSDTLKASGYWKGDADG
jgi:hypothetical protein